MKLPKDTALDILDGFDAKFRVASKEITSQGRWSTYHRLIVTDGLGFWAATYSVGSTENQDEEPWEYEDEVEFVPVRPVPATVIVYEEVKGD